MDTFKFIIVFLILLIFLWLYGFTPTIHYLALPIVLLSQHLFNTFIANMVAASVPFLPDLQIIINNILRIAMYASGVLFSIKQVPEQYQIYFLANPMAILIEAYRDILMLRQWPEFSTLAIIATASFTGLVLSTVLMKRLDPLYARVLIQK
jgi:lipopolysaccharide transport system permease protein